MSSVDTHLKKLEIKPLYDDYQPLSHSEIAQIEARTAASLPADYKAFVTRFGVSIFAGCIHLRISDAPELSDCESLELDVFLGGGSNYNLQTYLEILSDRIDPGIVPIALEGSGVFLLDPGKYGKIQYWSDQNETLTDVADSFSDFVSQLEPKPVDPEEDEMRPSELLVHLPMHAIANLGDEPDDRFEVLYEFLDQSLQSNSLGTAEGGSCSDENLTIFIRSPDKEAAYELLLANLRSRGLLQVATVAFLDDRAEAYEIVWPASEQRMLFKT